MTDFEGIHFLASLEAESVDSDGYSSSATSEDEEYVSEAKRQRLSACSWSEQKVPSTKRLPFTGDSGLRLSVEGKEPIDVLNQFFTAEFQLRCLRATNNQAKRMQTEPDFGHWKPLTSSELSVFLGLVLHTGTIRMSNLSDYWSSQKLFDIKPFRANMTKHRFLRTLRALKFNELRPEDANSESRLSVVGPLVYYFNKTMEDVCYPGRELIIDNCSILLGNRVVNEVNFDMMFSPKPDLYLHALSEPNGLIHKVVIVDCASPRYAESAEKLMSSKTGKGHSLFLDANYCDLPTVEKLFTERTYCTGLLHPTNKTVPEEMSSTKLTRHVPLVIRYSQSGLCIAKWKARREVLAVSSEYLGLIDSPGGDPLKCKPLMIGEYKKSTREADRREFANSYKLYRGEGVEWYQAFGLHILQLMLKNAYLLYNNYVQKMDFHEFRLSVIDSLLKKGAIVETVRPVSPIVSDNALHVPMKFPKREGQRALRKRCKVCLREGKRTDSYYHCPQCPNKPAICLEKCFAKYHKELKVKVDAD